MDLTKLKGHVPDSVIAQLPDTMAKFEINTPLRLAHFLAQAGHESGNFRLVKENLNYSAKGLNGIFKKYFPTFFNPYIFFFYNIITTPKKIYNNYF